MGLGRVVRVVPGRAPQADLVGLTGPAAPAGRPRLGLVVRVVPVGLGPVVRVVLGRAPRADLVDLMDPAAPAARARLALVALVALVGLVPGDRVDPMDRTGLVVLGAPVGLTARAAPVDPGDRVGLNTAARAAPEVPEGPTDRVDPGDRVGLSTAPRVVPVDLVVLADPVGLNTAAPADRLRRRTSNAVSMTVVAHSGVAPGTRRTASVRPITAHRLRHRSTDSAGTADLHREGHHPTGTGHRPLVAGTGRRLPVAGILDGMARHATSVWRSATSGRSTTAASTPSRSSTRCSAAGASGSSARGSRCTDLSPA